MKPSCSTWIVASMAILSLLSARVAADDKRPGYCEKPEDCETFGAGFVCTAVSSNRPGLEGLNMCIPKGSICSGSISGVCPTFSSWPSKYQKVMSVCAFQKVPNCNKRHQVTAPPGENPGSQGGSRGEAVEEMFVLSANGIEAQAFDEATSTEEGSSNGTVECYERDFTYEDKNATVQGIYMCMDVDMYQSTNGGHIKELTEAQIKACGGNQTTGSLVLCNGQGTCAPKEPFSALYECKCNKGYDGDEYCSFATSNECSNLGQCGDKGKCELTGETGKCTCENGATGDQCDKCTGNGCGKNGKCEESTGKCKCEEGYTGAFCQTKIDESKPDKKEDEREGSATSLQAGVLSLAAFFVASLML